jgi:hypothetical protein
VLAAFSQKQQGEIDRLKMPRRTFLLIFGGQS